MTTIPEQFYMSPSLTGYLETQQNQAPTLDEVNSSISNRIIRFLGCNPGNMQLQGTNTYLIGTGSSRILIDTAEGISQWALNITSYLEDHDLSISHVLLTHWHRDHTGGVDELLAHDSKIQVCKCMPDKGQLGISDGQIFQTEGATLRAVFTPGHAIDHMCYLLEEENALFTGDNVLGHGYSVAEDLEAYTYSLRVMASLNCATGYPGHGDVIPNLPGVMMKYISHRISREKRVYAVLSSQASSKGSSKAATAVIDDVESVFNHGKEGTGAIHGERGLTTADIGSLIYGEVIRDSEMFDSAVKPLLNQVLYMLLDRGRVESKTVGPDSTRHWYVTTELH